MSESLQPLSSKYPFSDVMLEKQKKGFFGKISSVVKKYFNFTLETNEELPFNFEKAEKLIENTYLPVKSDVKTLKRFMKKYNEMVIEKMNGQIEKLKANENEKDDVTKLPVDELVKKIEKIRKNSMNNVLDIRRLTPYQLKKLNNSYNCKLWKFVFENYDERDKLKTENYEKYKNHSEEKQLEKSLEKEIGDLEEKTASVQDPDGKLKKVLAEKRKYLRNLNPQEWNKEIVKELIEKGRIDCEKKIEGIVNSIKKKIEKFKAKNKAEKELIKLKKKFEYLTKKNKTLRSNSAEKVANEKKIQEIIHKISTY